MRWCRGGTFWGWLDGLRKRIGLSLLELLDGTAWNAANMGTWSDRRSNDLARGSSLIVLVLCVGFLAVPGYGTRDAALQYAEKNWNNRDKHTYTTASGERYTFEYYDANCANFVSQCLIAGGIGLKSPIISSYDLYRYLADTLKATSQTVYRQDVLDADRKADGKRVEPSWFGPGDVAIFHENHPIEVSSIHRGQTRSNHSMIAYSESSKAHPVLYVGHTAHVGPPGKTAAAMMKANAKYYYVTFFRIPYPDPTASPVAPPPVAPPTPAISLSATVLVIDVSGSMARNWRGGVKIESARKAALQFIEQVANEPRQPGSSHMISVVSFSDSARLVCPLTDNYSVAKQTVIGLGTLSSTNLGAGVTAALNELSRLPDSAKRSIILLSDGMSNTGLSPDQILSGPVAEARRKGICIYTVGFGDPGDIDEDFLKKVASGSGCGTYNYAASGFELFGTYVRVRHSMLGSNRIYDFSSGPTPVVLSAGQSVSLGAFQLTAPAQELHYTVAWSESGRMRAVLVDPSGKEVTGSYPGATLYSGTGFMHVMVRSPSPGVWRMSAVASTGFTRGVQYYGVASARTGGIVIPYPLPGPICITIPGTVLCVPLPDMPTFLVVAIAVTAAAVVLYLQLFGR